MLKLKKPSKKVAIIGAIVVMIATIGVVASLYLLKQKQQSQTPDKEPNAVVSGDAEPLKEIDVAYEQLNDEDLMKKVNHLMGTRQYAEAEKLITTQNDLDKNKRKLSLLVTIQKAQGKESEALETAKKIEVIGDLRPGEYLSLARQYEATGDTRKAIDYYNKAKDVYNREKQGSYEAEVARIEKKIKELQ